MTRYTVFSHLTNKELVMQVYNRNITDPLVLELAARLEASFYSRLGNAARNFVENFRFLS